MIMMIVRIKVRIIVAVPNETKEPQTSSCHLSFRSFCFKMPPGIKPLDMAWQRGEQAMKAIRAEEDKVVASICRQRDNFERLLVDEMMEHAKTKAALEAEREARQVVEEALRLERQNTGVDQEKIKMDVQELFERAGNIHKLLGLPPASEPASVTADTPVEEARPAERVDADPRHVGT